MKKIFCLLFLVVSAAGAIAQGGSEIILFDLTVRKNIVAINNALNITKHTGYDNQPSFNPKAEIIYYSSFDADGRADILSYNYKSGTTFSITKTKEREYSPTVTLDGNYLSCIIQRDDGAQNLGKYPIVGGEPSVIIDNLTVGYHVWADNSHLGLFILGTPHSLHYLRLPTKKDTVIAQNIGRSLHRIPNETAISFVQKISDSEAIVRKLNTHTMKVSDVAPAKDGKDDLCWLPDGRILMTSGSKIYYLKPAAGATWKEVEINSSIDLAKGLTRLAVSSDGKKLAVVLIE